MTDQEVFSQAMQNLLEAVTQISTALNEMSQSINLVSEAIKDLKNDVPKM